MRVNLSARQLRDPGLVGAIRAALHESGIAPRDLCLELTESMQMQDVERSGAVLGELRALGVGLALDDFGTGYSSLSYLRQLQVDRLKIEAPPEDVERLLQRLTFAAPPALVATGPGGSATPASAPTSP